MARLFPFSKAARDASLKDSREHEHRQRTLAISRMALMISVSGLVISVGGVMLSFFLTQRSIQQANRAWVGLDGPAVIDKLTVGPTDEVEFHYIVKNFGHGPAIKLLSAANLVTNEEGPIRLDVQADTVCRGLEVLSMAHAKQVPAPMGDSLFPGQTMAEPVLPQNRVRPLKGNPASFWLVGCTVYIDQFKQSHWTRFCMEGTIRKGVLTSWMPYSLYNDTDESGRGVHANFQ